MNFLKKYIGKYKFQAILAPLFKMLEAIFELLVPLVMASIIDKGVTNSDTSHILRMGGVLLLLAIVGWIVAVCAQYFSAKVAVYVARDIRFDLFSKISEFSTRVRENFGEETLITRITSDVNQIQNGINMALRLLLRSPFIVFGAMIMAFTVDTKSAFVFVVVILILSLVLYLIMRYTLPGYRVIQERLERVLHTTSENLDGVRILRAFAREEQEKEFFSQSASNLRDKQVSVGKIAALLNPITYVFINVGIIGLIYVAGLQVDDGFILQGDVVALVNYMSQILVELIKLANLIVILMKTFPSIDRVESILKQISDERTEAKKNTISVKYDIQFSNVSFSYNESEDYDIEDISFSIPEGSVFGIVGGTGSGKSTLLRLMRHCYDVNSGMIKLGGIDVASISDNEINAVFGTVFQKAMLMKGTIKSNMQLEREYSNDEIFQALEIAQIADYVETTDNKLDSLVNEGGSNFSGGQRQRFTIARALVKKPKIIVLDDASSALDLRTERLLHEALKKLEWRPTVIIVSQRASSVLDTDQILVLEDGRCVGCDNHDNLLKNNEIYQEIYYAQYPKN